MTPEPFSPLETYSKNTIFSNCSRPFVTRTRHTLTETDFCLRDLRRQKNSSLCNLATHSGSYLRLSGSRTFLNNAFPDIYLIDSVFYHKCLKNQYFFYGEIILSRITYYRIFRNTDLKDLPDFFVSRPLYPPLEGSLESTENAELNLFSPLSVSDETDKTQSPAAKKGPNKQPFTPLLFLSCFPPVCLLFFFYGETDLIG